MREAQVAHAGDGLDSMVWAVASLPAVAEDLIVLHSEKGVLDAGADHAGLCVALFVGLRQRSSGTFEMRDYEAGADVAGTGWAEVSKAERVRMGRKRGGKESK
ncbi:hypothetical protein [Streptomyces werraensis]|uniref:hypothetical protein n=1 Tax=Streptomyces werraensis TaxID=68284 RepID=UPI003822F9AC